MRTPSECRLYGILDLGYVDPDDALTMAGRMLDGGVEILQLRGKKHTIQTLEMVLTVLQPIARKAGVPLIVNDHPKLVLSTGCDGVHVGQDDGTIELARAKSGGSAWVGRSTHSLSQAADAIAEKADYIGFGPLFATPTKPDYTPIGTADIAAVHERHPAFPIFCIGGIKLENLPSVVEAGARRVVIVSGILQAQDVEGYCRKALALLPSGG